VKIPPLEPPLAGRRVLRGFRTGSSWPALVETDEGVWFVKLRGAAQGTGTLVSEVLVSTIAAALGLPVPRQRLVTLGPGVPTDEPDQEFGDLLRASAGENLGLEHLAGIRTIERGDLDRVGEDFASQVVWLDGLVMNPDRTWRNPNVLVQDGRFWLIDHGAAFPFHHNWPALTEDSPRRPWSSAGHVLASRATRVAAWDRLLAGILVRDVLHACVARIPESFLAPLLPADAAADALARRRAAYVAFMAKRLKAPRPFPRETASGSPGEIV